MSLNDCLNCKSKDISFNEDIEAIQCNSCGLAGPTAFCADEDIVEVATVNWNALGNITKESNIHQAFSEAFKASVDSIVELASLGSNKEVLATKRDILKQQHHLVDAYFNVTLGYHRPKEVATQEPGTPPKPGRP